MSIHQISVFLENRSGQLAELTQLLASQNVDIRAISIAETADYGLARMIVDDVEKASSILLQHGTILSMTPVWAVEVPDRPAGLAELLAVLAKKRGKTLFFVLGIILVLLGVLSLVHNMGGFLGEIPFMAIGIPAVTGFYFDWFGGCIQAFIFCTLTTLFIKQAAGD